MSTDVSDTNTSSENGTADLALDDQIVTALRADVDRRRAEVDALRGQIAQLEPDLKRRERALALLIGETATPGPPRGARGPYKREKPSGLSEERMATIRQAVLDYAVDHEEFSQVEVRSQMSGPEAKSSVIALGFEALRQENLIRFARKAGNRKMYRLTHEAVREHQP